MSVCWCELEEERCICEQMVRSVGEPLKVLMHEACARQTVCDSVCGSEA